MCPFSLVTIVLVLLSWWDEFHFSYRGTKPIPTSGVVAELFGRARFRWEITASKFCGLHYKDEVLNVRGQVYVPNPFVTSHNHVWLNDSHNFYSWALANTVLDMPSVLVSSLLSHDWVVLEIYSTCYVNALI